MGKLEKVTCRSAMADKPSESRSPFLEPVKENLSFQSFLRKRKDTLRFWTRYWFKLQNTTLSFYTDRESQATSLRGQYYMNTSADSEDLRDVWIQLLWKAMQLPGPGHRSSSCTWYDIPELLQRVSDSSGDGQLATVTPDHDLKDDIFGSDDKISSDDESDVPEHHCMVLPPYTGNDGSNDCYSIYDYPRPQAHLEALQPKDIVAEEYMTMNQLSLYDTPKLGSLKGGASGAASPVCVSETAAEENMV